MKIACIAVSTVPSGTANSIQVMKVCQSLAQAGHEVCLWLPYAAPASWEALAEHYGLSAAFELRRLPARHALRRYDFAWQAVRQAKAWGAQAVYTWVYQAALFARWHGLPLLLELHERPTGAGGPLLFRLAARPGGRKRFLFITRALQGVLEGEYGLHFQPAECVIAPDGVDVERYQNLPDPAEARRRLNLPQGLTAGYTGHLYPGRGVDLLVRLAQRFPQLQFLWVGGKPDAVDFWRGEVQRLGLANVTLTGFVPNRQIPLYQAAAEILLMPYERTVSGSSGGNTADVCSPMKMFEYMACGRAILSSDLPVLHEVLSEASAVFCPPPPQGAVEWEQALERLAADPGLCLRLGAQARRDAAPYAWLERARRSLAGFVTQ